mgnify:CR=1 FL=1
MDTSGVRVGATACLPAAARRVKELQLFTKGAISKKMFIFCAAPIASDLGPQGPLGCPKWAPGAPWGPSWGPRGPLGSP